MTTDFIYFTENIKNVNYIKNYIKSYMLLFSCISIFILVFCYFFSAEILEIFDPSFVKNTSSFLYLIIGICGILILRGLFGNLLSSIGKAHVNFYITSVALILNLVSNYYLIPKYGIKGAAITTACLMWITGVLSLLCFWHLYRKGLKKDAF
jgi:Na+-driven multidrug efflux pump